MAYGNLDPKDYSNLVLAIDAKIQMKYGNARHALKIMDIVKILDAIDEIEHDNFVRASNDMIPSEEVEVPF